MANILEKYGIKEVADVTFYEIAADGTAGAPVLFLDTLKVSSIEQTAEMTEAKGGKGNVALIAWDFGKEITVNIEDALFSIKSMAIMFGNGTVDALASTDTTPTIYKTIEFNSGASPGAKPTKWTAVDGKDYTIPGSAVTYTAEGVVVDGTTVALEANKVYYIKFPVNVNGTSIDISANSFPGSYYVTGDTFARSAVTGDDEYFQFIIPKAKMMSENTLNFEAEGDPTVFNMSLRVLRPSDGVMMKLVQYTIGETPAV